MAKAEELFAAQEKLAQAGDANEVSKSFKSIAAMLSTQRAMMRNAEVTTAGNSFAPKLSGGDSPADLANPTTPHNGQIYQLLSYLREHGVKVDREQQQFHALHEKYGRKLHRTDPGYAEVFEALKENAKAHLSAPQFEEFQKLITEAGKKKGAENDKSTGDRRFMPQSGSNQSNQSNQSIQSIQSNHPNISRWMERFGPNSSK